MKKIENFDLPGNTILIVGANTRPILKSAKELGFKTIAVDHFGDLDVAEYADKLYYPNFSKGKKQRSQQELFELAEKAVDSHEIDSIIVGSGMEHNPSQIEELEKEAEVIGNDPEMIGFCENEKKVFQTADKLNIPHPETEFVHDIGEALEAAESIGYPVVLKPSPRGGGIGIKLASSPEELRDRFERIPSGDGVKKILVQEFIEGTDTSTSILSNGSETECLSINEQIIGEKRLGVPRRFGYSGGIVPLDTEPDVSTKMHRYSREICREIGLVGSNGIDFVISEDEPYLVEINPRFQNTMDLVEDVFGINLLSEHIRGCRGEVRKYDGPRKFGVKLIVYSEETIEAPDLSSFNDIADIPRVGSRIDKGSPICSVLKFGTERNAVLKKAYDEAERILQICHS